MKNVLLMIRGVIVAAVTLVIDVVLYILDRLMVLFDFPGDLIWAVYSRLKDWSDRVRNKKRDC